MSLTLQRALESAIDGEVRFDKVSRALYSTDASVYQIEPLGVVIPRSAEEVVRAVALAAQHGVPITPRGGGTSQAGQSIGAGLVLDTSKYLNRVLEINPDERWARVEPGVVLDELNAALRPHDLRFAPDVSSASRATVGGMMANNSSGAQVGALRQDHRSRARAARGARRRHGSRISGRSIATRRAPPRPATASRRAPIARFPSSAARHAGEIERRFPEGAAPRRRLQPRRLRRSVAARRSDAHHGRLRRHAGLRRRRQDQAGAAAGAEGRADDRIRRAARRARRDAGDPEARPVGGRGDGRLHPLARARATPRSTRSGARCQRDGSALLCVEFYGDSIDELQPRMTARRARSAVRRSRGTMRQVLDPAEAAARSGASARRRSGCRWR